MIVIYSLCLVLVIFNIVVYILKRKDTAKELHVMNMMNKQKEPGTLFYMSAWSF